MRALRVLPLLAALLFPTLLTLVPSSAAQPGAVELAATREGGTVAVDVRAPPATGSLQLLVTHEDPVLGTVVDRVVPVNLSDGQARVALADLRFESGFTIRALDIATALPELPDVTRLYNGSLVRELPELARTLLAPLTPASRNHTTEIPMYPVITGVDHGATSLIATRGGILVSAGFGSSSERLEMRFSRDGGHAYSEPIYVSPQSGNRVPWWVMSEAGDGQVVLLHKVHHPNATSDPWTLHRIDPVAGRIVRTEVLGGGEINFEAGNHDLLMLPTGEALLAFDGRVTRTGGGQTQTLQTYGDGVKLWSLSADGGVALRGGIGQPPGPGVQTSWVAAASETGIIGLVTQKQEIGQTNRVAYYSRSFDGGRTFTPYVEIPSIVSAPDSAWLQTVAVDATGTIYASFHLMPEDNDWASYDALHVRIDAAGTIERRSMVATTPLPGRDGNHSIIRATTVVKGTRVWLLWTDVTDVWAMESLDNGRTFRSPIRIRELGNPREMVMKWDGIAILPDGRPVFLASGYLGDTGIHRTVSAPLFDPAPLLGPAALLRAATSYLSVEHVELDAPGIVPGVKLGGRARVANLAGSPLSNVALEASAPPGVSFGAAPMNLAAGAVADIPFTLQADALGDAQATLVIRARVANLAPSAEFAVPLRLVAQPLTATPSTPENVTAGGETVVRVTLANGGPLALPNVVLRLQAADGTSATTEERGPSELAAGATGEWAFRVGAPIDARGTIRFRLDAAYGGRVLLTLQSIDLVVYAPPPPDPVVDPSPVEATPTPVTPTVAPPPTVVPSPATADEAAPSPDATPTRGAAATDGPAEGEPAPEEPPVDEPVAPVVVAVGAGAGLTGVALVALAATDMGRYGLGLAGAALYARIRRADALRTEARERVHAYVRRAPGARFNEIARELGLASSSVALHLRVLEREGFVRARTDWTRRRYYPIADFASISGGSVADTVLALLRESPGLSQAEVARRLGISRQLAQYHLRALETRGVLALERDGERARYFARS